MKEILEISSGKYIVRQAGLEDIEKIHQVEEKKSLHYHGVPGFSLELLQNYYREPGFDIKKSIHLVEDQDGKLVAHVEVWDDADPPVLPYIWLAVDPDYENQGLESYLLDWAEKRSLEALERVDPDVRVAMRSHSAHVIESSRKTKLAAGMKQIRHSFRMRVEMDEQPPEPVWPEGITMRLYNPETDAYTVFEVDEEVFQDHFGFVKEAPEEAYKKFTHHMTKDESYDPGLWFLALDGEEIVGICLCRKYGLEDKEAGYISSLGVKRPWRRKGIALALLQHAFGEFYKREKRKVDLGVDAESLTGATDLYRKAGMFVLWQFDLYEKELRPGKDLSINELELSEG
ncbi:MAG: GNAT family N-acetyltransferase [Anaerolineales bacterium]